MLNRTESLAIERLTDISLRNMAAIRQLLHRANNLAQLWRDCRSLDTIPPHFSRSGEVLYQPLFS